MIVTIIQHFNWRWVAFLNSNDAFGHDGLEMFMKMIKHTDICLAYTNELIPNTDYDSIFKQIEEQRIRIIVVFAPKLTAEALIESAMQINVTDKVWIAGDTWSLNEKLPKKENIKQIGTVLGVSQPVVTIPGFTDFIMTSKTLNHCENAEQQMFCNQTCNCTDPSPEDIISIDPSFSFSVYSATYAIAHALHNTLQCGTSKCNGGMTVHPYMVRIHDLQLYDGCI